MPNGMNWHSLFGLSLVGGIGFTVALFLTALSYPVGSEILNQAKLGIIAGSLISGFLGYYYLKFSINRGEKNNYRLKKNSQAS
jgi:NhaA family Na+:H+ antiporter